MTELTRNPLKELTDEDLELIVEGAGIYEDRAGLADTPNEDLELILIGGRTNETQRAVKDVLRVISEEVSAGRAKSSTYTTDNRLLWQELQFGARNPRDTFEPWSGYIAVDEDDLASMVDILLPIAKHQAINGRNVNISWLLGTVPEDTPEDIDGSMGIFGRLLPTDPRLIIVGEGEKQVRAVLEEMAKDPRWNLIEKKRILNSDGIEHTKLPHLPGTTNNGVSPQIVVAKSVLTPA